MIVYKYSGINRFGKRVKGEVQANNIQDLEQRLRTSNITVLSFKEKSKPLFSFLQKKRVSKRDIITITVQIRQLLGAGVALMDILDDLRETYENETVREMLSSVYEDMEGGSSLSEALKTYEKEFGPVYVSLVSVGEKTGQLEQLLKRLEEMMKWEESLASKAKKVMIYPSIVALVVVGVVLMMMLFVVPELVSFIEEMEGELGFATIALIATSAFIQKNIMLIMISPFIIVALLKYLLNYSEKFKEKFDYAILKIKIIGPVLYNLKIARLASSLSVMYASGVSFTDSLRMSVNVLNNRYLEKNIVLAVTLIEDGSKIYEAFQKANIFPSMAIRMIKVGEVSGNMDEALLNISDYYDAEAKNMIEKIKTISEGKITFRY